MKQDRDVRWGAFLLIAHGWKDDVDAMVIRAPNGQSVKYNELFRLANKDHALAVLERGGTAFSVDTIKATIARRAENA